MSEGRQEGVVDGCEDGMLGCDIEASMGYGMGVSSS